MDFNTVGDIMLKIPCYRHTKRFKKWKNGESREAQASGWRNKGHLRQLQLYRAFSYMCINVWCIS